MARIDATLILMVTRGRLHLLRISLEALCKQTPDCRSIMVVDNGSGQETLGYLEQKLKHQWIDRLVCNPASTPQWQKSYAIAQVAQALEQSPRFTHFAWIDSDVEVARNDWLKTAKIVLSEHPRVDICSLHNDDLQEKKHPTVSDAMSGGHYVRLKHSANGAAWVMRCDFFKQYGLPPIGAGCGPNGVEDIHYSKLVEAHGRLIAVVGGFATHHGYTESTRLAHSFGN